VLITNKKILLLFMALSLVMIPLFFLTTGIARITITLLVVFFVPGYSLLSILFPSHNSMAVGQRVALSFGISIVIVSGLGLLLHFIPLGLNIISIFFSIILVTVFFSIIALYRDNQLLAGEKFCFRFDIFLPKWRDLSALNKGLFTVMVFTLLALISTFSYVAFTPNEGEQYTEFYVLDSYGSTGNYPEQIRKGESIFVTIGIISHEENPTNYRIETTVNGIKLNETRTDSLSRDEKWEKLITLTPRQTGNSQKLEFWLFKFDQNQPYNKDGLHLMIDVLP
jgi:uncharacterized membrane protein